MINLKNKIKNSRVENTIGVLFCYIGILIEKKKKALDTIKNSRVENTIGVLFCYIGILIAKKKKEKKRR